MAAALPLMKNGNGKRDRNQMEAEDSEFAPLSKRINNLHLYHSRGLSNSHPSTSSQAPGGLDNGQVFVHNGNPELINDSRNAYPHNPRSSTNDPRALRVDHVNGLNHNVLPKVSNVDPPNGHHLELHDDGRHYEYNPSLDSNANPHYYESNRQLYLLYLERMQRTGQTLHPQFFQND